MNVGGSKGRAYFSPEEFRAFREQNHVFEDMIAHGVVGRLFYDDGKSTAFCRPARSYRRTLLTILGVPPLLGRTISEEDGRPGATPVFVMNYRLCSENSVADPKHSLARALSCAARQGPSSGSCPRDSTPLARAFGWPWRTDEVGGNLIGRLRPDVSGRAAGAEL